MLLVHGTAQPLVRGEWGEYPGCEAPECSPDQPHLAAPCCTLSACLSQARGVFVPSAPAAMPVPHWALGCSKAWPTDWLPTLTLALPCCHGLTRWLWLWPQPGCPPCASPIFLIQVMWGGPWLVRNILAVTLGLWFPLPTPQPSPCCLLTLHLFIGGLQWPFCFPSRAKDFLSLMGLSIFCFSKGSACLRNCHTLGDLPERWKAVAWYRASFDSLEGAHFLSWRDVNKGPKFHEMFDLPKFGYSSTAQGWEWNGS